MRLSLQVAWRFIWRYKSQSILITIGIAVGISVLIFIGSLIKGLQESLIDVAIGRIAHITVASSDEDKPYLRNYEEMILKLDGLTEEVKIASPAIVLGGFGIKGSKDENVSIKGVDIERGDKIYKIKENLVKGRLFKDKREVVIGTKLSESLEVNVGDKILLKTATAGEVEAVIVGIFDLKSEVLNQSQVYMSFTSAQQAFGLINRASIIDIQVYDVFKADEIMLKIRGLGAIFDCELKNWKDSNASLLAGLNSQTVSTVMIQAFVLISVILGISSVLAVSVMQKSKQIGILKAMGLSDVRTSWIFIFQGAILSGLGILLGVLLGLGLIEGFVQGTKNSATIIKISLDYMYIFQICIISFVMSCISVTIPARKTKTLDPIEVIKNG